MTFPFVERRRTCLAFSPGGHKAELDRALIGIVFADSFHVTFDDGRRDAASAKRTYFVCHPRRSIARTLLNALQSAWILLRHRPALLISSGADVAVPILMLARMFGVTTVFIETGGSIEPTLAGRLSYPFSDLFLIQWPEKRVAFSKAVLINGPLL